MHRPFELYDLRVTVESIEGRSVCGLAVGDYFELTESAKLRIPPGKHFCIFALSAVLPLLAAKQRELADNDWMTRDTVVACPDVDERLIMRIETHEQTHNGQRRTNLRSQIASPFFRAACPATHQIPSEYRQNLSVLIKFSKL